MNRKRFALFALLALFCILLPGCHEERGEQLAAKPVIYLYPEVETAVTVRLDYDGQLTCTYPAYDGGWTVTAQADGTLTDGNGQSYNYLYWEACPTPSSTSPRASASPVRIPPRFWRTPWPAWA